MMEKEIVFYDSECATCHGLVKFILARGKAKRERFRFLPVSLLSRPDYLRLVDTRGRSLEGRSVVLVKNGLAYQKADAVFGIFYRLGFPWDLILVFRIIPLFLLDIFYDLFARYRYAIFGKADPKALCEVPDPELRRLFLNDIPEETHFFAHRPGTFLGAEWTNLVFLNYEIPEALLLPLLPKGTELDLWQGKALASIVAFEMRGTLVLGRSLPWHEDFEEVNLRFYVKRRVKIQGREEIRRGVVFVKEIVPRHAIAWVARILYNENYVARRMAHRHSFSAEEGRMEYSWQTPAGPCTLKAEWQGRLQSSEEGSLEEFITEHYWGYARQRNGATVEYEVEHPRWPVWTHVKAELSGPVAKDYGDAIAAYLQTPVSICAAKGSAIRVYQGKVIV